MTRAWLLSLVVLLAAVAPAAAQLPQLPAAQQASGNGGDPSHWDLEEQLQSIGTALVSLPLAAALGAALAFRPRRRGTPPRSAPVIQTQIILAVVGAVVMLVVGASLARAFGIVGAASLIRYRAKIDDPKDAGVMLSTLAVGLASGVGLYALAIFATLFILAMLWGIESLEPEQQKAFILKVTTKQPSALKPALEQLLKRQGVSFELRSSAEDEVSYEVRLPVTRRTDRLSNAILRLDGESVTAVDWEEKKVKG